MRVKIQLRKPLKFSSCKRRVETHVQHRVRVLQCATLASDTRCLGRAAICEVGTTLSPPPATGPAVTQQHLGWTRGCWWTLRPHQQKWMGSIRKWACPPWEQKPLTHRAALPPLPVLPDTGLFPYSQFQRGLVAL